MENKSTPSDVQKSLVCCGPYVMRSVDSGERKRKKTAHLSYLSTLVCHSTDNRAGKKYTGTGISYRAVIL